MAEEPIVTIVTATYNRAKVLARVIRSVKLQTLTIWRWIIVGDAWSEDTEKVIAEVNDERINFVNLPERFGEQSGPNSVGAALAKTPYISFLNHDDFWLPDHLQVSISSLQHRTTDLVITQAVFTQQRGLSPGSLFFREISPAGRLPSDCFQAPFYYFEPISCWSFRRDSLMRLGPMRLASEIALPPIHEYIQRAVTTNMNVEFIDHLSVIKNTRIDVAYDCPEDETEFVIDQIANEKIGILKDRIGLDVWLSAKTLSFRHGMGSKTDENDRFTDILFEKAGINSAQKSAEARLKKGQLLSKALKNRTGESLGGQPDIESAIAYAKARISQ